MAETDRGKEKKNIRKKKLKKTSQGQEGQDIKVESALTVLSQRQRERAET